MGDYKPVVGDRVRATFEVEVTKDGSKCLCTSTNKLGVEYLEQALSVEKVEPPVVTFKPGDVVRRPSGGSLLALAQDGWFNLGHAKFYTSSMVRNGSFTSKGFELVDLSK